MTFTDWLQRQIDRDDPVGHLACDVARDSEWPKDAVDYSTYKRYLGRRKACNEALIALLSAWRGYVASNRYAGMSGIALREAALERRLAVNVERLGGKALKFISPGWAGAQDRIVLMPGERIWFVEMKRPGAKPRPLQVKRAKELQALGFKTRVVSNLEELQAFLLEVGN